MGYDDDEKCNPIVGLWFGTSAFGGLSTPFVCNFGLGIWNGSGLADQGPTVSNPNLALDTTRYGTYKKSGHRQYKVLLSYFISTKNCTTNCLLLNDSQIISKFVGVLQLNKDRKSFIITGTKYNYKASDNMNTAVPLSAVPFTITCEKTNY